jgi:hypothetical protein
MWEQLYQHTKQRRTILIAAIIVGALIFGGILTAVSYGVFPWQNQSRETAQDAGKYPVHRDIIATVFWVGEDESSDNDYIHNRASYWISDWIAAYGGIDDPECREGYGPCGFEPRENPFYFALPYGERTNGELRPEHELRNIPWYETARDRDTHLLKNRWVSITYEGKTAYAQWQDVGPFEMDDKEYVFGGARPTDPRAGIDLSPATALYLDLGGRGTVDWQFVDETDVPAGPWTEIITRSGPMY